MHNRQTGAAHVPIMFFLILLVMFLGALGFAYVQQTTNAEVVKARDAALEDSRVHQEQALLVQHYIEDIGKVINKPGKYTGRDRKSLYGTATLEYSGVMDPDAVKKLLDDATISAKLSVASSLENVLGSMITKMDSQDQRVKDVELEKDKALADKLTGDTRFTTVSTTAQNTASETSTNLDQAVAE
ncbi:MAG: hypothetical protein ACI89X_004816, partial [Planctomycetota bacterium]